MAAQDPQPGLPRPASGGGEHVEPNCFTGGLLASAGDAPTQEGPQPEEALRKWEEKLLRGCPASFEGIAVHDNGRILDANRTLAKMVGYELSELIGMEAPRLVAPEWRDFTLQKRLAGCEEPYEAVALRKDGSTFLAELRGRVIPFDGRTVRVVAIRDITELKRAEETLRESEKRFRTSVENMLDCFGIYSAIRDESGRIVDFRIEYVNGAACANNLMSEDEQVGRRLLELLPAHRETGLFDEYCQVVETGMPLVKESLFYEDDYREQRLLRAFDIRAAKLGDGFAAAWRDITERKRAEEALAYQAQLLASVNDAIISTDEQFILRSWNPAAERIYGWKAEEVLGRPAPEVLRTEYPGAERSAVIGAAVETGNFHGEVVQYRKDGTAIQVESKVIALRDDCERTTGYVGVNRDITQRKRAEEALRQAEGRYRFLFEQAPAMYVITRNDDGAPIITDCNELFLVTLGYPRAEALGRPLADFYTPPSRARLLEHNGYQRALEGRFMVEGRQLVTRDGRVVETVLRAVPELDDGGRTIGTRAMYFNITERKRAEEALQNLATLPGENPNPIIRVARNGTVIFANRSSGPLLQLWGCAEGASLPPEPYQQVESALTAGKLVTGETVCGDRTFLVICAPIAGRDYVNIYGVDITERKGAEEALRESESRYRLLAENASDMIWTVDTNLRFTYVSPSVARIRGYSAAEVMAQTLEEVLTLPSLKLARRAFAEELAAESTGRSDPSRSRTLELEHICKDGSTVWAEVRMTALRDESGRIAEILGVSRDIGERRRAQLALEESERRYRLLAENATDIIWITDLDLRGIYVNPAVTRVRGYTPEEAMVQTPEEILTPASLELARKVLAEELAKEQVEKRDLFWWRILELENICKDGSTVWLEEKVTALRDEDERIVGILGISRDISERRRAEEALQEAREELESRVEHRMRRGSAYGLTFRELTVLHLVVAGKSDKEIGAVLGISNLTASKHLANILRKMDAASRTEAGVRAVREGLLD